MKTVIVFIVALLIMGFSFFMGFCVGIAEPRNIKLKKIYPWWVYSGEFGKPCAKHKIKWMEKEEFQRWSGFDPEKIDCVK